MEGAMEEQGHVPPPYVFWKICFPPIGDEGPLEGVSLPAHELRPVLLLLLKPFRTPLHADRLTLLIPTLLFGNVLAVCVGVCY